MSLRASEVPATAPAPLQRSGWELACWIAMPVLAALAFGWFPMLALSTVGCEGICHDELIFGAYDLYPWLLVAVISGAAICGGTLAHFGRRTWWVAVAGLTLVLAVVVGTTVVIEAGLQPMRERNARAEQGILPPADPPPDPTGHWVSEGARPPAPDLTLTPHGAIEGFDGCNPVRGSWTQDSDGFIRLTLNIAGSDVCDGVDTWLSRATSAVIQDGNMVLNGRSGTPTGVLYAAP